MSQRNSVICDRCGQMVLREGHTIPIGWMHLNGWFRPEEDTSGCSGCADLDLCPECIRKSKIADDLADRCAEDYKANMVRVDRV